MNRRSILTAASSSLLLAGCLNTSNLTGATVDCSEDLPDKPEQKEISGEPLRSIAVSEVTQPDDPLEVEVSLVRDTITTNNTAELWVRLTNTGSDARELKFGMRPPFSKTRDQDREWGLFGNLDSSNQISSNCWGSDMEPMLDDSYQNITLGQCESLTDTLYLGGIWVTDDDACMPTGEFTFDHYYEDVAGDERIEWEFSINVDEGSQ